MHGRASRDVAQWQRIAHEDVGLGTANNLLPHLKPNRLQDVALFTIGICEQRDSCRAIRIVFDGSNRRGNAGLIALEIDDADLAFVSSAAMPASEIAGVAASTGALLDLRERLMRTVGRDLVVDQRGLETQ